MDGALTFHMSVLMAARAPQTLPFVSMLIAAINSGIMYNSIMHIP